MSQKTARLAEESDRPVALRTLANLLRRNAKSDLDRATADQLENFHLQFDIPPPLSEIWEFIEAPSIPAIVTLVLFVGRDVALDLLLDALDRRVAPRVAIALSSQLARYPSLLRMARYRAASFPLGRTRSFVINLAEEESDLADAERFLRDFAEKRGPGRLFAVFEGSKLARRIRAGWLEEVVGQPEPAWIPRVFGFLKLTLPTRPDPEAALKLQQDELLAPLVNAIVGEAGLKNLIENLRDPTVVMRLYDAFPSLRREIRKLPMSPRSLLHSGHYYLMERAIDGETEEGGQAVVVAAGESPLWVVKILAKKYWPGKTREALQNLQHYALERAAENNRREVLEWFLSTIRGTIGHFQVMAQKAAQRGHFALLRWLLERFPGPARPQNLDSILRMIGEYVKSRADVISGLPDPADESEAIETIPSLVRVFGSDRSILIDYALRTGSLSYVNELVKSSESWQGLILSSANSASVMTWALNHQQFFLPASFDNTFVEVCGKGKLEVAQLLALQKDFSNTTIEAAAELACVNGRSEVSRWLNQTFGVVPRLDRILEKVEDTSVSCMKILASQASSLPRKNLFQALIGAAVRKRARVVEFLLRDLRVVLTPGEVSDSMYAALQQVPLNPTPLETALIIAENFNLRRADLSPRDIQNIRDILAEKFFTHPDYKRLDDVNRFVDRFDLREGFFTEGEIGKIGLRSAAMTGKETDNDVILWRYLTFGA